MLRSDVRMTSNLWQQPIPQSDGMSLAHLSTGPGLNNDGSIFGKDMKNVTNISHQTCADLVCFIWFAESSALPPLQQSTSGTGQLRADSNFVMFSNRISKHHSTASIGLANYYYAASPSPSRTIPSRRFSAFVNNILNTTQVSDSIIKLSLYYIYCLKVRNTDLHGQLGSEYRLFLTSLILANKFLDDFTYTNKTWSEVSHTPLCEITKMEMQLFAGIGTNANLNAERFRQWSATLDVLVKQRDRDFHLLKLRESPPPGTFSSPPLTMTWSSSSSPAATPVLTPHCNPVVLNHCAMNDLTVDAQSLKKRKRCLESDTSDSEDVYPLRRRLVAPSNTENLVQFISGSTMGQTRASKSAAPPYSDPDSQTPMSTGVLDAGLESEYLKPYMRTPFGGQSYSSMDRMSINGNVNMVPMPPQEPPGTALDARISPYGAVLGQQMPTPELYWALDLSPDAFVTQISPTPRKLGYYQLASGYSYGILATMTTVPNTNVSSCTGHTSETPIPPYLDMHAPPDALHVPNIF